MKKSRDPMNQTYYDGIMRDGRWPSIVSVFNASAARFPDRPAFSIYEGKEKRVHTYREASEGVRSAAHFLRDSGIRPDDKVLLIGKNSPSWAAGYLAIQSLGAVVVPIDTFASPETVSALSLHSEVKGILADPLWIEKLEKTPLWNTLTVKVSLEESGSNHPFLWNLKPALNEENLPEVMGEQLAAILYTSGTTGNEKGVMLTHANLISDAYQASDPQFLNLDETDVFYGLLPLHHSYAMTAVFLESIIHGSELLFSPKVLITRNISEMRMGGVTNMLGIPLLYNKIREGVLKKVREKGKIAYALVMVMLAVSFALKTVFSIDAGKRWFASIRRQIGFETNRLAICGGGPLSSKVVNFYTALGITFLQGYGLTETSPIITLNPKRKIKGSSVGIPFPLVSLRIADPDLLGVGEIEVKGPNITQGYFRDEKATKELFSEDGYLKTGDLGSIDRDGYVYIRGRAKNLIVTEGGKNVYPEEIEELILLNSEIEQAIVRKYVDNKETRSEQIELLIFTDPERAVSDEEVQRIVDEVNRKLPPYKRVTKTTRLSEAMEMTSTRKIKRGKLQRTFDRLKGE